MPLKNLLNDCCDYIEEPRRVGVEPVVIRGFHLPVTYLQLLDLANGFVVKHQVFRFFGIACKLSALDLQTWNQAPWVSEYGRLADGIVFIAEDIFGDQYGLRFADSIDPKPALVKFWCEGGETEVIPSKSLLSWLTESVLRDEPAVLDWKLASDAFVHGLMPSETEHLSYSMPLIVGGEANEANLEAMDRVFHLHILGQLSLKNQRLPEGDRIGHFWSES